jgi:hypothetical protein
VGRLRDLFRARQKPPHDGLTEREANVAFANDLLDTEIAPRNAHKDAQENTARGVIVASGLLYTLLLGLAKDAGLFASSTSAVARVALAATILAGGGAAACAIGTLWPRKYDRLGSGGLGWFNDATFLDRATHRSPARSSPPGSGSRRPWTRCTSARPVG